MKTKVTKIAVIIVLSLVLVFGFAACGTDQDLLDKIAELEQKLEENQTASDTAIADLEKQLKDADAAQLATVQAKITALETANAAYKTQIDTLTDELETLQTTYAGDKTALEAAIKANKDHADALTEDLSALTDSVANATHIERAVIKPEDVGKSGSVAKTVYIKQGSAPSSKGFLKVNCTLGHGDFSFNYQLITFIVSVSVNGQAHDLNVSVTQAKSNESTVDQTFQTNIVYNELDTYEITWSEIILYRFV